MAFTTLETARLIVRRFRDEDLETFLDIRNDPEVARYQSWESVSTSLGRAFIKDMKRLEPGLPDEWFQFAVEHKETGELIGDCALKVDGADPPQAEIGYTLARAYQGKGLAQEMVSAVLALAFSQFNVHRVIAQLDVRNDASAKLLERLGFRREGHFIQAMWFKGAWSDEYLYALLRSEWLERRGK